MSIFNPERLLDSDIWVMDGAAITFGSSKGAPTSGPKSMDYTYRDDTIVAIGCQIQYQRPIQKRYPINVRRAIYMVGMPDGQITFDTLFGPGISIREFINKFNSTYDYDNSCIMVTPFSTSDSVSNNGTGINQGTWCITRPVLQSIGLRLQESQTADIQAIGSITMQFSEMDILDDDAGD